MPRRRRRFTSPISFFAFQDIITAVSAIVIVIVLLLTLELIQRPMQAQSVTATVSIDLEAAVARARAELERLESELADRDRLLQELAELTPQETERQIRAEQQKIHRLEQEVKRLQEQRRQLADAKKNVEVEHFDQREDREKLAELRRQIENLQEELKREENADRPLFTLPRGVSKGGWVVVVAETEIQAAPMNHAQKPLSFTDEGVGSVADSPSDKFVAWARIQNRKPVYLLILLRPSGSGEFDALSSGLTESGISYGFDLIGEEEAILDPVSGAGP